MKNLTKLTWVNNDGYYVVLPKGGTTHFPTEKDMKGFWNDYNRYRKDCMLVGAAYGILGTVICGGVIEIAKHVKKNKEEKG